jgi:exodeoxyribonuclease VII small subunit
MQQPPTFEDVYKQLEESVRRLEEGGLTLDESIALYEQGMTLAEQCRGLLDRAELRVVELQQMFAGAGGPGGPGDEHALDPDDLPF